MGRLFWKIFIACWLALLLTAGGGALSAWFFHQARGQQERGVEGGPLARSQVDAAIAVFKHGGVGALRDWMGDVGAGSRRAVRVVDTQGREVLGGEVSSTAVEQARVLVQQADRGAASRLYTSPEGATYLFFAVPGGPGGAPPAEFSPPGLPPEGGGPSPLPPLALGLLLSLGLSSLLAWYLTRPVKHLKAAFSAFAAGKLETRVGSLMGRRDEIADLGQDFDRMAQRLQGAMAAQQRLLHDVSHELRSPLARLHVAIGLARKGPEKIDLTLERIERESARLDQLLGEVLTLSRLESGVTGETFSHFDVADVAADVVGDADFEAQAMGRRVTLAAPDGIVLRGIPSMLHRALENLVRNGIKYADPGTVVEVKIDAVADRCRISVCDRGPGVPAEELEVIFTPFYRGENGQGEKGFGLGLAIARRAVLMQGGSLRACNREGGGLCVEVLLLLASP